MIIHTRKPQNKIKKSKLPKPIESPQELKRGNMFVIHGKIYDMRDCQMRNVEASFFWHVEDFVFSKE